MRNLKLIALFFLLGICPSCNTNDESSKEQEVQNLNELFSEIENLALSVGCDNASEWTFTSYGSKACGGPVGYIAFSTSIDVALLLERIEAHKNEQEAFNQKWEIMSDCSAPQQPTGVICQDGNPIFEY